MVERGSHIHSNELMLLIETVLKQWVIQEGLELEPVVTQAKKPFAGQYTTTLAFMAAKSKGVSPKIIAATLAEMINSDVLLKGMHAEACEGFVNVSIDLTLKIETFEKSLFWGRESLLQGVSTDSEDLMSELPYWLYRARFLLRRLNDQSIETLTTDELASVLETPTFLGVRQFLEQEESEEQLQNWLIALTHNENLSLWSPHQLGALKTVNQWLVKIYWKSLYSRLK